VKTSRKPSEKSLKNLRRITPEQAREMQKLSTARKRQNREEALTRDTFKKEITRALGMKLLVTPSLRESFRKFGVELDDSESVTRLSLRRALMKSLKDGDIRQLLMLAEFAGFRNDQEESEPPNGGKIVFEVQVPAQIPQEVQDALRTK
jgi:hypothetical protein